MFEERINRSPQERVDVRAMCGGTCCNSSTPEIRQEDYEFMARSQLTRGTSAPRLLGRCALGGTGTQKWE